MCKSLELRPSLFSELSLKYLEGAGKMLLARAFLKPKWARTSINVSKCNCIIRLWQVNISDTTFMFLLNKHHLLKNQCSITLFFRRDCKSVIVCVCDLAMALREH